ncbi:MAG: signal recognition particle-docking protein FtsY [Bacillota bacterium]
MFKKIISKLKGDQTVENQNKEDQSIEENVEILEESEINEGEYENFEDGVFEDEDITDMHEIDPQNDYEDTNIIQEDENVGSEKTSFFNRLKQGLSKTKQGIADKVDQVLKSYKKVDEELFEEIEEILITSDVGVNTTLEIINQLRKTAKERKISEASDLRELLKEILVDVLDGGKPHEIPTDNVPMIILVVGVNGVGKTTSIGKIAHRFKSSGKKVLLAAGDTFRAAAIDQLEIWGKRVGVDVIKHQEGADPAAVVYDAIQSAKARKIDVLICDTAGRLHNKKNLMNELGKVSKVVEREYPDAYKEVLLVLDATTGQNAIQQAKTFKEVVNISGIVLTKLDGTAKGGIVLAIGSELDIPVKLIGVGEGMNDLQSFVPTNFIRALFGEEE